MKFIIDIPQDLLPELTRFLTQAGVDTNPEPVIFDQQRIVHLSHVRTYYENEMKAYFPNLLPWEQTPPAARESLAITLANTISWHFPDFTFDADIDHNLLSQLTGRPDDHLHHAEPLPPP